LPSPVGLPAPRAPHADVDAERAYLVGELTGVSDLRRSSSPAGDAAHAAPRPVLPSPVGLPAPRVPHADLDAERAYLVGELTGVPELHWPPGPPEVTADGGPVRVAVPVSAAGLGAVDAVAAGCGVSRFVVLLALWAGSVAEVTGQRDFAVGVPVAQRDAAGLEDVVGCHITMLCLRLRGTALDSDALDADAMDGTALDRDALNADALNADALNGTALDGTALNGTALNGDALNGTALDGTALNGDALNGTALHGTTLDADASALRATGKIVARAFAAQDVPLGDVLTLVDPPRTGRPPLYQVLFALQDNPVPDLRLPGLRSTFLRQPYPDLPLELHTECWPDGAGGLSVETTFHPWAVPLAAARAITDHFADRVARLDRRARRARRDRLTPGRASS
ncbi:hypothetical protein JHN63_41880, partial [Streptomyces sp. MBT65]|nr:hypothetical protein [Streptomyces sp. MBT65]